MIRLTPEEAKDILEEVPADKHFRIHLGTNISNLKGLLEALEIISNDSFKHHVSKTKNDFSKWVSDVVGDVDFASELRKVHTKKGSVKLLKRRIRFLERKASEGKPLSAKEWMEYGRVDFLLGLIIGFIIGIIIVALL